MNLSRRKILVTLILALLCLLGVVLLAIPLGYIAPIKYNRRSLLQETLNFFSIVKVIVSLRVVLPSKNAISLAI
ncbi:MAG: hypothetical protein QG670_2591 [Thermoproteota archaeon]|nr:hypothetical protein [Thermoproteota archaeon]